MEQESFVTHCENQANCRKQLILFTCHLFSFGLTKVNVYVLIEQ